MARSTAYWAGNFYQDPDLPPRAAAPLRDLPPLAASRFRMLRDGLKEIDAVTEKVRFILPNWKWTWEYALPTRKLCWLHVLETGVAGTFSLADDDHRQVERARPAAGVLRAIQDGVRTGPVTWCSLDFTDRKSIDAFLGFMKKKAAWVAAAPQDSRVFRGRSAS